VAESVDFLGPQLLVALRDCYYVLVLNCETLEEQKYSLNGYALRCVSTCLPLTTAVLTTATAVLVLTCSLTYPP
jgi:hypothetical protein